MVFMKGTQVMACKLVFILGADDPEMQAIERLLKDIPGVAYTYATKDGQRVHPRNAYSEGVTAEVPCRFLNNGGQLSIPYVTVECRVDSLHGCEPLARIDHHRPGRFLEGSSIGQILSLLAADQEIPWDTGGKMLFCPEYCGQNTLDLEAGEFGVEKLFRRTPDNPFANIPYHVWWVGLGRVHGRSFGCYVPDHIVLTAAADHCLAAAYRGECPGVDPDALMKWRAEGRAAFQQRSVEDILADIESAQEKLITALGDGKWADMRGEHVPELPEAACRLGVDYVAGPLECPDGRKKIVASGNKQFVQDFLDGKIDSNLTNYYGDPVRGFAGGYLPE